MSASTVSPLPVRRQHVVVRETLVHVPDVVAVAEHEVGQAVAALVRRHVDRADPAAPLAQLLAALELAGLRLVSGRQI